MALYRGGRDRDRDSRSGRGRFDRSRDRGDRGTRAGARGRLSLTNAANDRRFDRLQQRVSEDQRFQVPVFGNDWLCPYCLELLGAELFEGGRDPLDVIFQHTANECQRYQGGRGMVVELFELLERRIELLLAESQEFNFFDAENRWICPYDMAVTNVLSHQPDGTEIPLEQRLIQTLNYLENCQPYLDDPYSYNTLQSLLKRFGPAMRIRKLANQLRPNVLFRFAALNGGWVCPYCHRPIDGIFLRADGSTPNATVQMAQHMLSGQCVGLQHKFTVSPTIDQMRALTLQINQQMRATLGPGMLPMNTPGLPDLPMVPAMPEVLSVASTRGPSISGILSAVDPNDPALSSHAGYLSPSGSSPISPISPLGPPPAPTTQQLNILQTPTPGNGLIPPVPGVPGMAPPSGMPLPGQPMIVPPGQRAPSPGAGNSPSQLGITPPPWQLPAQPYQPPATSGYVQPPYPPQLPVQPSGRSSPRPGTPVPGTNFAGPGSAESIERMRLEEERA